MKKLENLNDIVDSFNEDEDFPTKYNTVGDIVNELISKGSNDEVHAFYDDYLGLENDIDSELLETKIDNIQSNEHEEQIDRIIEEANTIKDYQNRELTEDMQEEIEEDKKRIGY